ncbi:hypothetical protein ABEB36_007167 [Hypothenemus hampei]|uniref:Protein-cysteine N-palmitoyltransferase Rasp n=1 Tax=Hypothenemus hampei TaxID=57062 RepID=A0ABD1ET62_HYPHA
MLSNVQINQIETKLCFFIWISTVTYSIYRFTVTSQKYFHTYTDNYDDFIQGWSFMRPMKRDKADFEWETIGYFIHSICPTIICYLIVHKIVEAYLKSIKIRQFLQVAFSLVFLMYFFGLKVTFLVLLEPIFFYFAAKFHKTFVVWICSIVCLSLISLYKQICATEEFLKSLNLNYFQASLNISVLCWMNLKCTSFCLNESKMGLNYWSYCMYFPTLLTGPFIPYKDYENMFKTHYNLRQKAVNLTKNVILCLFWWSFSNFWLHFIYINATGFQLELVKQMDLCSLCGYGYLMGQFFHIKYVVFYGLSTSLAAFDGAVVPRLPRCIGRIHLYSDMWKYFDPGLYDFLKICIFIPTQNYGLPKMGASLLCFSFVYAWHGIEDYIFVWALLNFCGIFIEHFAEVVFVHFNLKLYVNAGNLQRLKCAFAAPLLAMSAVSNFYFFAGLDIGNAFAHKFISEPIFNQFMVLFVLYCCGKVSIECRNIQARKMY